jgi:predicted metal-dependent hydrolase
MVQKTLDITYTVRISDRAKKAKLVINQSLGLEVVIPRRFDHQLIPQMIAENRLWIQRNMAKIRPKTQEPPHQIHLQGIDQMWQVSYKSMSQSLHIQTLANQELLIIGNLTNPLEINNLLRNWIIIKAKQILPQLLRNISISINLPYRKTTIRSQKTIWASCSRHKDISLNYKLLLLPPELMAYVCIHELCHTKFMNHSAQFWELVKFHDADYELHDRALKSVGEYIPSWL